MEKKTIPGRSRKMACSAMLVTCSIANRKRKERARRIPKTPLRRKKTFCVVHPNSGTRRWILRPRKEQNTAHTYRVRCLVYHPRYQHHHSSRQKGKERRGTNLMKHARDVSTARTLSTEPVRGRPTTYMPTLGCNRQPPVQPCSHLRDPT